MSEVTSSVSNKGITRPFPRHREMVLDILKQSQRIPSFPILRSMELGVVANARADASVRLGWTTLFAKAYALVSREIPELRDIYVGYPRRCLYRHPHSVASISIHRRDDQGNERLIFGRWVNPESATILQLQEQLDMVVQAPMAQAFREGGILERRSGWVRQLVWTWLMNWAGRKRAKHIGTFSISSLGGQGALNSHHPLVTTSSLAIGPIDGNGHCDVVLICDHRALDGFLAARALQRLEEVLRDSIVTELRTFAALRSAA
jgi:hypothetical protein